MKLISHRGNINSILVERENTTSYIDEAISQGYDVEIDVRLVYNKLFLGHDAPDYEIDLSWLMDRKKYLWVHTKNFDALSFLIDYDLRIFYHQKEDHTIINNSGAIWSHNLHEADKKSIIPLLNFKDISSFSNECFGEIYGVCSDYIYVLKDKK